MFPEKTKILVVDDMTTMRKIVKNALKKAGLLDVTEANDGDVAWPKIEQAATEQKPFDLIISDWNMPIMNGLDLLKKVRAYEAMKTVPFVMLTAETEKAQIIEAAKAGVTTYVMKPFKADELIEKLGAVYTKLNG